MDTINAIAEVRRLMDAADAAYEECAELAVRALYATREERKAMWPRLEELRAKRDAAKATYDAARAEL